VEGITRELFEQQRSPRFGTANPELMHVPFWEWMIRGEDQPGTPEEGLLGRHGMMMRNGVLKSGYGPWRVRDKFEVPLKRDDGPIWTFDRMGRTENELPDGRVICVGGEHEDFYDPDFCIYNDVVVFERDGEFQIYGYPEGVFPPTDFHTATLVGNHLILIGGLRYPKDRYPGTCPVYRLDTTTLAIERLATTGDGPGWLFHHTAEAATTGVIVRGGELFETQDEKQVMKRNVEEYRLDTETWAWQRLTDRRQWREFMIRAEDGRFWFEGGPFLNDDVFFGAEEVSAGDGEWPRRVRRVEYDGVTVEFCDRYNAISVLIQGAMSENLVDLLTAFVGKLTREIGRKCQVSPSLPASDPGS
jgi:hypothetical protein